MDNTTRLIAFKELMKRVGVLLDDVKNPEEFDVTAFHIFINDDGQPTISWDKEEEGSTKYQGAQSP